MRIGNVSETKQYKLFETAKQILSGTNQLKFLLEEEYDLIAKGISREYLRSNHTPDSMVSRIANSVNSRYVLYVEDLASEKGGGIGSYTPLELDEYNSHYYQGKETNSASMIFRLVDTEDQLAERTFQIHTTIGPLTIKEEDGGETRFNMTSDLSAVTKAFEKGVKQLRKGVVKKNTDI